MMSRYWRAGDTILSIVSKEIADSGYFYEKDARPLPNLPSLFIQRKLVCCSCGEKLRRIKLKASRIHWDLQKVCHTTFGLINLTTICYKP